MLAMDARADAAPGELDDRTGAWLKARPWPTKACLALAVVAWNRVGANPWLTRMLSLRRVASRLPRRQFDDPMAHDSVSVDGRSRLCSVAPGCTMHTHSAVQQVSNDASGLIVTRVSRR